jgi:hypothetical protein
MGQSINPIFYRIGFFRAWNSLYGETLYIKNYNFFLKSQIISEYLDGFFKRWTWDGKRSFFLNYLFSHVELSWSHGYIHMYIYVYSSYFEYVLFKLKKNLKISYIFKSEFKNLNKSSGLDFINSFSYLYKNYKLIEKSFFTSDKLLYDKGISKLNIESYKKKKKNLFRKYRKIFKSVLNFRKNINTKKYNNVLETEDGKYFFEIFSFISVLLKIKYYKTALLFVNYFFSVKPLEYALKRFFLKDFYNLLALKKKSNFNFINLQVVRLLPKSLTSSAIGKHIWLKLKKKYSFGTVIKGIVRMMKQKRLFKGALISCNGRFTKKQKAWHSSYRYGKVPLSEQKALIDDSLVFVTLKYGLCSVRININYKSIKNGI